MLGNLGWGLLGSGCMAIAMAVAIREMEVEEWGRTAALIGIAQVFGGFLSFGTPIERVRRYARASPASAREMSLSDTLDRFVLAAGLVASAVGLSVLGSSLASVVFASSGVFLSLGAPNYFAGVRRYIAAGALVFHEKLLALLVVLSFVAVFPRVSAEYLLIALGAAGWLTALAGLAVTVGRSRWQPSLPTPERLVLAYRRAWGLGIASIGPTMLLLDASVVRWAAGSEEAAYFGIGVRVVGPATIVISSLVIVLLPHFASAENRFVVPAISVRSIVVAVFGIAILTGLGVSAHWWVPLLFGDEYTASVATVRLYLINALFVLFTRTFATILQAWDDDRLVALAVSVQVLTALIGIAIGARVGGAQGASFSLAASNAVLAVLLWLRIRVLVARHAPGR